MVTKSQAECLRYGDILYAVSERNADGSPQRWRVNGACKTWKRSPERFRVPLKHGLWSYGYLDETTAEYLCLTEEEARGEK